MKVFVDYNLTHNNTFGIDVSCRKFVECSSEDDVATVVSQKNNADEPFFVLGEGSNILFTKNYNSTILHSTIKGINVVEQNNDVFIRCGSGEIWDDVVGYCVANGWSGLENLSYIPGSVGASATQNIGAYGSEAKDVIIKVEAIELSSGKKVEFSNSECNYSYRNSNFKNIWKGCFFITYVTYKLCKTFVPNIHYGNIKAFLQQKNITSPTLNDIRNVVTEIRKSKLPEPKEQGNAGSFFMNPIVPKSKYLQIESIFKNVPHYTIDNDNEKIPAGWLIEQCGWKGKSLGRAAVHNKQALVLVNNGGATGNDIVALCNQICVDVKNKFGITIMPEVNIL